jgi:undecaprenyl-diphosphatase
VTSAAILFTVLLVLVRLRWRPLEAVDHGAADRLNNMISGHPAVLTGISDFTLLGSTRVLSVLIAAASLLVAVRRRWRLAAYLLVTGAGALALDPVLKVLVGRLRPVVAHPVAHAPGNSFPSGHSLGSIVCFGALFLVFLPAVRGRWRTWFAIVIAALIVMIGFSRILLGVHFVSDVIGGWAIGIAWLGLTAFAFELTRRAAGRPVSHPVAEGLEPEAGTDLRSERASPLPRSAGRTLAGLLVAWVLILGAIIGIGELITRTGNGAELGDAAVPRWLAAHRTPDLTRSSLIFTTLGGIIATSAVAALTCLVLLGITRRWRPAIYLAVLMLGELAMFVTAADVVKRAGPPVPHLDKDLRASSYPSPHVAATCCLYIGLAILVIGHGRGWWRWLSVFPAVAFGVLVAASRMYRGEHPTDVLASVLFAALWVPAATLLLRPNSPALEGPGQGTSSDSASMLAARSAAVAGRAASFWSMAEAMTSRTPDGKTGEISGACESTRRIASMVLSVGRSP